MAKRTEVLLVKDVLKLGNMGDLVRVTPGYARNYLYPEGLAIHASAAHKRQIEVLREKAEKNEADREAQATAKAKTVQGLVVQIAARVVTDTELFGSIGTKEIVAALAKAGLPVDGKQVHLVDKIKRLGRYEIEVRLHKKVPVTVTVEVINSDPNAPTLAEAMAAEAEKAKARAEAAKNKGDKPAEGEAAPADDAKPAEGKGDKPAKGEKPGKGDKAAKEPKADKAAKPEKGNAAPEKAGKKKG